MYSKFQVYISQKENQKEEELLTFEVPRVSFSSKTVLGSMMAFDDDNTFTISLPEIGMIKIIGTRKDIKNPPQIIVIPDKDWDVKATIK